MVLPFFTSATVRLYRYGFFVSQSLGFVMLLKLISAELSTTSNTAVLTTLPSLSARTASTDSLLFLGFVINTFAFNAALLLVTLGVVIFKSFTCSAGSVFNQTSRVMPPYMKKSLFCEGITSGL